MKKVAINGFGRIGALFARACMEYHRDEFELAAINASGTSGNMVSREVAHRLTYDSNYGCNECMRGFGNETVRFAPHEHMEKTVQILGEPDAAKLPWKELGIDVVVDCTGEHLTREKATKHLQAGAKKVILSAPPKDDAIPIFVYGINHREFHPGMHIVSNASCTTNALAPITAVLKSLREIVHIQFDTVHAFTGDQRLTDGKHSDPRRARRASGNIIPTKTGAAKNIEKIFPELRGKTSGIAFRVDTPTVSVLHATYILAGEIADKKELADEFKKAASGSLSGIMTWTEEELVSSDFLKNTHSVIVDLPLLKIQPVHERGMSVATVTGWYDNEWAYACRLNDLVRYIIHRMR